MEIWSPEEFKHESNIGYFNRRSDSYISNIDKALQNYAARITSNDQEELSLLQHIFVAIQAYFNRPKTTSRRQSSIHTLRDQVINRMKIVICEIAPGKSLGAGLKNWEKVKAALSLSLFSTKPTGKSLSKGYWIESIAPHFAPHDTFNAFKEWERLPNTAKPYLDWLREEYLPRIFLSSEATKAQTILNSRVSYLTEIEREDKEIYINNGIILNSAEEPFHTGSLSTSFSGKGWAIYVMATDNKIYAHSHETGIFHHSSFLSGGRVKAAGEIAVDQGRLVGISPKSGHYQPDAAMFLNMLTWLHSHNISLSGIAAWPDVAKRPAEFYDALAVMQNGGRAAGARLAPPRLPCDLSPVSSRR